MTILFAGGELDGLVPSSSSVNENTNLNPISGITNAYDSDYARCAIHVLSPSYAETQPAWSAASTFWFHGDLAAFGGTPSNPALLRFFEGSTEVFRIVSSSGLQMYYLSATATFTAIGAAVTGVTLNQRNTYDVKLDRATGTAELYIAGTLRRTATVGEMTMFTGVTSVQLTAQSNSYWSQILCSTTPTIGRVVSTKIATGNGANTAWTGDYTGIDEAIYDDTDGISSGTANQVETFTGPSPTVNGFKVEAVVVNARGKRGESGPQSLQLAIRTSSTNYFSSTIALTLGYTGNCGIWEQNPNTTADWVAATAQAIEFGVKSIA